MQSIENFLWHTWGVLFYCKNSGGLIIITEKNDTGRISGVFGNRYNVILGDAEISAKFAGHSEEVLVVGDYVAMDAAGNIVMVLPRKNVMARRAAGRVPKEQVMAANIDYAFIVTSMNNEFNPRRLERYMAFLNMQDIEYYLVLTKADLCEDADFYEEQAKQLGFEDNIIKTSVVSGVGLDKIAALAGQGKTSVFIGSSGVGKSSIINYLMEGDVQTVSEIRAADHRGRHTTTHRELFMLPGADGQAGGAIIDTPGMREIQFWSGGDMANVFEDIDVLAEGCKFRDCGHDKEPGCAVKDAIKCGLMPPERLKSYNKLKREAKNAEMRSALKDKRRMKVR